MGAMSPWHWAIVALVVVILFGSKKLPDAARGLGRSLRIFKSEVKEMQNDGATTAAAPAPAAPPAELPPAAPVADPTQSAVTHTEPRTS
ncbi:sec-independent protein translocase protein TatA [Rhodococcus sp. PvR044]|jgi:sec-independent protein translocase protein TatA|uniref:Sec-independent protein translocase subunit TatA n=1 Tax=unclassified Rhodococcus (in: high G+C Gram-positive bacteria) TaxID=192944 RepID=UPI000BCB7FF8|nr:MULTISPECIES: Sec-independent protein translocase subunit TatA [unclassified Rhodococcus (in: high G+C Gram-positive bacteria)]PTR45384.1 sec-independent protein translocase protein TatA [Rhodococcus sp. OK611]SNX88934.1 sec-independent protein translocase protein TatA [Rhodococcus sp. OK270]